MSKRKRAIRIWCTHWAIWCRNGVDFTPVEEFEFEKNDVWKHAPVKQEFYAQFVTPQKVSSFRPQQSDSSKGKGKHNGGKNPGKGNGGPLDGLSRFDLRRSFPSKEITIWQVVLQSLEHGATPCGSAVVCDSVIRMTELQALAAIHYTDKDIILVAKEGDEFVGSKLAGYQFLVTLRFSRLGSQP